MNQKYSTKMHEQVHFENINTNVLCVQAPMSTGKVNREGGTHLKIALIKRELVQGRNITLFGELQLAW